MTYFATSWNKTEQVAVAGAAILNFHTFPSAKYAQYPHLASSEEVEQMLHLELTVTMIRLLNMAPNCHQYLPVKMGTGSFEKADQIAYGLIWQLADKLL